MKNGFSCVTMISLHICSNKTWKIFIADLADKMLSSEVVSSQKSVPSQTFLFARKETFFCRFERKETFFGMHGKRLSFACTERLFLVCMERYILLFAWKETSFCLRGKRLSFFLLGKRLSLFAGKRLSFVCTERDLPKEMMCYIPVDHC